MHRFITASPTTAMYENNGDPFLRSYFFWIKYIQLQFSFFCFGINDILFFCYISVRVLPNKPDTGKLLYLFFIFIVNIVRSVSCARDAGPGLGFTSLPAKKKKKYESKKSHYFLTGGT